MPTWIKCLEDDGATSDADAAVLHINLDNVLYITGSARGSAIFFVGRSESEEDVIKVRETPEQITARVMGAKGDRYLRRP